MKTIINISFFLILSCNIHSQDTINISDTPGNFWVDYYDSIDKFLSKEYCWRREEYINNVLFSIEFLAMDKHHPVKNYTGYYPNGNLAFKRSYLFDGTYSEAFGNKELYYENGKLKEKGIYHHGIKCGNWKYYNNDGSLKISTQYESAIVDTISRFRYLSSYPDNIIQDTLRIESDTSFYDFFPVVSFGKNGIEVIYEAGKPFEVRTYEFGKLILATKKKREMRKLLKQQILSPDIRLCGHRH